MTTDFFCDRPEPLPGIAALAGAYAAPDVLADRQAIAAEPPARPAAPSIPPTDLVERLAAALAAPRPWQRIEGDPARAMAYFRGMARNRLDRLDPVARGLLVSSAEAEARRWAAPADDRPPAMRAMQRTPAIRGRKMGRTLWK